MSNDAVLKLINDQIKALEAIRVEIQRPTAPTIPALLARLPERFRWTLHNLVAHPLSEVLYQVGLHRWSDIVHDRTVPAHEPGTGRG